MTKPRKGQFGEMLSRDEFRSRFHGPFGHPAFEQVGDALAQVEEVAWDAYINEKSSLAAEGIDADVLDLSRLISDYDWHIHPCKGCVSTAMPLCHWPCSCYPNHGLRQTNDWMGEI
jgi:hypothetical protein